MAAKSRDQQCSSENCGTVSDSPSIDAGSTTPRNEGTTSEASTNRVTTQEIVLTKSAGLGISIAGGVDRPGGGTITVTGVMPGGDCHKDGRLQLGDALLSINAESLEGVSHEAAKSILTSISLNRDVKSVVLRFRSFAHSHDGGRVVDHSSGGFKASTLPSKLPTTQASTMVHGNSRSLPHVGPTEFIPGIGIKEQRRSPGDGEVDGRMEASQRPLHVNDKNADFHRTVPHHNSALPPHPQRLAFPGPLLNSTYQGGNHSKPDNSGRLSQSYPSLSHIRPDTSPSPQGFDRSLMLPQQPQSRKLSIEPTLKLKVDKLQEALEYLGLHLTEEQKSNLRGELQVDRDGMVRYGEFVSVVKQLFKLSLDETSLSVMNTHDTVDSSTAVPFVQQSPGSVLTVTIPVAELELLKRERDSALQEARKYQSILQKNERTFSRTEEELQRVRKDAQAALHESRALKSRVHLAEAAQREARNMEMDYETVVRRLETEVSQLRKMLRDKSPVNKDAQAALHESRALKSRVHLAEAAQREARNMEMDYETVVRRLETEVSQLRKMLRDKSPGNKVDDVDHAESADSLRQRLAVLGGELRKSEASKKTYEVATERLLKFAELVHDVTVEGSIGKPMSNDGESARRGQNGMNRLQKKRAVNLATEAKEVFKVVKALIEEEPLPYGWEETYTKDGSRFFINHVTQTTSWVHPVSNINYSSVAEDMLQETDVT